MNEFNHQNIFLLPMNNSLIIYHLYLLVSFLTAFGDHLALSRYALMALCFFGPHALQAISMEI